MLGSKLWDTLNQIHVATGNVPSGGGSSGGSGGDNLQEINTLKSEINDIKSSLGNVCGKDEIGPLVAAEASKILGDAPESLDSFKEIAEAITGNASAITDLQDTQASKMDTDDIKFMSSEKYNKLSEEEKTAEIYFITD